MKHCRWFNFEYKEFGSCTSSVSDSEHWDDGVLADSLAAWAIEFSVKQNAIDKLLNILQLAGHRVPSTARSLLKTAKHVSISEKSGMQYVYLDVKKQLQRFVETIPDNCLECFDNKLEISLNIAGLPLFKSSSTSVWPILCAIVALACGQTKPSNLDFLTDIICDFKDLLNSCVMVGARNFKVQ